MALPLLAIAAATAVLGLAALVKKTREEEAFFYDLKDGRRTVYKGITNNPLRRAREHLRTKKFTRMDCVGPVPRSQARQAESDGLASFRRTHGGRNPRYNQTNRG